METTPFNPSRFINFVEPLAVERGCQLMTVKVRLDVHAQVRRHCDRWGLHPGRFYRDVFAAALRDALERGAARTEPRSDAGASGPAGAAAPHSLRGDMSRHWREIEAELPERQRAAASGDGYDAGF